MTILVIKGEFLFHCVAKKALFIYVRGLSDSFAIVPNDKKNKT